MKKWKKATLFLGVINAAINLVAAWQEFLKA